MKGLYAIDHDQSGPKRFDMLEDVLGIGLRQDVASFLGDLSTGSEFQPLRTHPYLMLTFLATDIQGSQMRVAQCGL
jgi:hypothetical protein